MQQNPKERRDQIEHEAAGWVVRLSDGGQGALGLGGLGQSALEAWLAQGPEYEIAYARQLSVWTKAGAAARTEAGQASVLPFRRKAAATAAIKPWRKAAAVAAVAVLAVGGGAGVWLANTGTAYATAVGEHRVVRLEDGSRVEMNTATRIVVRYTPTGRNIQLQQGEALFEVAPNKNRPFNVMADNEQVRAVGTAFNVRLRSEGIDVLVSKGVVDVSEQRGSSAHRRLPAGIKASFLRTGQEIEPISSAEIERTLAWRYGAISLNGQTLRQATAEFNRYNVKQLEVVDPQIADVKLGGYFRADDLDNFVQALKTSFGIEATRGDDQTLYLSRAR
ncbi:MAG TPA: FecR domain-containing protein [Caulobacteraceae bacterium]|jgi:transmembrane sensor